MAGAFSLDDRGTFSEEPALQAPLPPGSKVVQRWVWESQFGAMLIEVVDDVPYVNGVRVERAAEGPKPALRSSHS